MSSLDPEHSHRNHPQGAVALGALVVAGGQAAVLLAARDQVLDAVAQPVDGPVERPGPALVTAAWDGVPDAAPAAVGAAGPAGIPLVARDALRPHAGAAAAWPPDGPLLEERLEG